MRIIVFGTGDAGVQLIHRLATQPDAAYEPVTILDDDPSKRHLRIHGVPVLGGRGQMSEGALRTGTEMLVRRTYKQHYVEGSSKSSRMQLKHGPSRP